MRVKEDRGICEVGIWKDKRELREIEEFETRV